MERVNITYPVDALVSFHYYRQDRHMADLVATGRLRLIGDSGAFSAATQGAIIDLDEYADWVKRWRPHLFWAASLDVIGDPRTTWRNWRLLRERHGLDTIPTLHAGCDPSWLDAYAAEGVDFVGLGGMAGTGMAPRAFRWAVHMFRYARDRWPNMRFHLWGVTQRQYLDNLPAYSADSSGILGAAYRYASLRLFDPFTGKHHTVALRPGHHGVYKLASLLRRVYGVAPAWIETSHAGNRTTLIQLAVASTQQYAAWLRRRRPVPAPSYGIQPGAPDGVRGHVVDGSPGNLLAAVEGEPRVHMADTDRPHLAAAVDDGPRVHLVDAAVDKRAAVADPGPPDGPRVHVVFGSPGSAGDEGRTVANAPDGPRVHVVFAQPGRAIDEGRTVADAPDGPRVHMVAGAHQPTDLMPAITQPEEEPQ